MKRDPVDRGIYRGRVSSPDLVASTVVVKETDLFVLSECELAGRVREIVITQRDRLESYIRSHPLFRESLEPLEVPPTAPRIVREMAEAARAAGVGPMAAVAGAVCDAVARGTREAARELIVENGGDVYLRSARERVVGIFSGDGGDGLALGIRLPPRLLPLGVCTSSGRIGHSLSFGDSAAATVLAPTCALADAAATAVGNRVRGPDGLREGLAAARRIPGVLGAVVIRDGELAAWGEVELVALGEAAR